MNIRSGLPSNKKDRKYREQTGCDPRGFFTRQRYKEMRISCAPSVVWLKMYEKKIRRCEFKVVSGKKNLCSCVYTIIKKYLYIK